MYPADTKIMIVDDMTGLRQLLKGQLKLLGFSQFVESENGEQAYTLLRTEFGTSKPVGLLISDWNMPRVSGMEFLQRVRADKRFENLPFLMVTAEGELKQVVAAIQAGVSEYMVKPFSPDTLKRKMISVWNKHQARG